MTTSVTSILSISSFQVTSYRAAALTLPELMLQMLATYGSFRGLLPSKATVSYIPLSSGLAGSIAAPRSAIPT